MYTCRQPSARQHRSIRAAGIHDDISTSEGRWASHGGGARPTLTPRDQINFMPRTNFQPHFRGQHAEIISNYLRFGSHAGKQGPENVGAVAVVCRLLTGGLCGCVAVLAVGCVLCTVVRCDILTWLRWPVGHADLLLFVLSISFSIFGAQTVCLFWQ